MIKEPKSYAKRDSLIASEKIIKDKWKEVEWFKTDFDSSKPKFFVTFPYPYMNGKLHMGHAFTLTKAEFIAKYKRMNGYNVLFPFGFHGTGMPIATCANRVSKELKQDPVTLTDKSQINILKDMGVPDDLISKFADPYYWIDYFPKHAIDDLKEMGISADFERSFITTDVNPYYDSFVKWQFNILKDKYLKFGKKYIIYSPKDNQPCSAHDRSIGEEIDPKEYTIIKLKLVNTMNVIINQDIDDMALNLLVATLRPETLYGQTNVWINNDSNYSLMKIGTDYCIARYDTFKNLSYQRDDVVLIRERYTYGAYLEYATVFVPYVERELPVLHMKHVSDKIGTGIVTSVPTDSPTDYIYWKDYIDLISKDDSVAEIFSSQPKELVGIIDIDGDDTYAKTEVEKNGITIKKASKLQMVNEHVYKIEHQKGILKVGKYAGESIRTAHDKIKKDLIDSNRAFTYYEPSGEVISRSGDACVVALTDQWYIDYGNTEITQAVNKYIDGTLNMYNENAMNQIKAASDWICEWPCSRHYGLGTKLYDTDYVIDSLSDSTIYMAYYTICHKLNKIPLNKIDKMWESVFLNKEINEEFTPEEKITIQEMKDEFNYWYPLDLRVSGKDLVSNHLTMTLYNHMMVWQDPEKLPRGYRTNGYVMLNGEKMSKGKGNFMTLRDSLDKYGADATRISLALSGDSIDDANFDENICTDGIMLLTNEYDWIQSIVEDLKDKYIPSTVENIWDKIFSTEIDQSTELITKNMEEMNFRRAFVEIYNLISIKDRYTDIYKNKIHELTPSYYVHIIAYITKFVKIMNPFCPLWSQKVKACLSNTVEIDLNSWPKTLPYNSRYNWIYESFTRIEKEIRKKAKIFHKKKSDPGQVSVSIEIYKKYNDEQLHILQQVIKMIKSDETINEENINKYSQELMKDASKENKKKIGQFTRDIKEGIRKYGHDWIKWTQKENIDEYHTISEWMATILQDIGFKEIICTLSDATNEMKFAPGYPKFEFIY